MMLNSNWLGECHAAAWLQPCLFPLLAMPWLGCIQLNLSLPVDKPEHSSNASPADG